jgi:uncharacterized membrane protein YhdT
VKALSGAGDAHHRRAVRGAQPALSLTVLAFLFWLVVAPQAGSSRQKSGIWTCFWQATGLGKTCDQGRI